MFLQSRLHCPAGLVRAAHLLLLDNTRLDMAPSEARSVLVRLALHDINNDFADDRAELEAVTRATSSDHEVLALWVKVDPEVAVKCVAVAAETVQEDLISSNFREVLAQELAEARLLLATNFGPHLLQVLSVDLWHSVSEAVVSYLQAAISAVGRETIVTSSGSVGSINLNAQHAPK